MQVAAAVRSLGATVLADEALHPAVAAQRTEQKNSAATEQKVSLEQNDVETGYEDIRTTKKKPDLTVWYIDRDTERDFWWRTLPLFVLSAGFAPFVADFTARAELRIADERGVVMFQKPLVLNMRSIYGTPALYFLLVRWINLRDYKSQRLALADNLYQFVQNSVHAQYERVATTKGIVEQRSEAVR